MLAAPTLLWFFRRRQNADLFRCNSPVSPTKLHRNPSVRPFVHSFIRSDVPRRRILSHERHGHVQYVSRLTWTISHGGETRFSEAARPPHLASTLASIGCMESPRCASPRCRRRMHATQLDGELHRADRWIPNARIPLERHLNTEIPCEILFFFLSFWNWHAHANSSHCNKNSPKLVRRSGNFD